MEVVEEVFVEVTHGSSCLPDDTGYEAIWLRFGMIEITIPRQAGVELAKQLQELFSESK